MNNEDRKISTKLTWWMIIMTLIFWAFFCVDILSLIRYIKWGS